MKTYKKVYIEITNVCNLSCSFCPKTQRESKFLSVDEFKIVLKEIKPYTKYIYFHLMGEPLLNPNLEEFLKIAYEEDFKVNITTNGTLLKKVKDILFKSKALRQINISLHSFEANNKDVSFLEYFDEVLGFIKEANENTGIVTAMRLWNLDSYSIKGDNSLNADIVDKIKEVFDYKEDLKTLLNNQKRTKLMGNLYLNVADKFQWPNMNIEPLGDTGFCHGLRDHFGILVDGTVVPCCLDGEGDMSLGNIYKESLHEILNGDRSKNFYNGFSNRKKVEELCKRCGYSERFSK
ncbi:radical SAM/SPASM domain-containing protein [Clostridium vincentii]|uniref:Molybdenum cofactor biosynthesis protein A n=1 Tax=Clostridium vincentii TaxID=52704 RepID=A0A2T0BJ51_9CLOT|nr:radical SAM/SPASM domain-containing protein [Clostridium vincentii]PRR83873.1 molybdenum cofactor biosynthesis protein A [Clostridium vincentii]